MSDTHREGESDLEALRRWKAQAEQYEARCEALKVALEDAYFNIVDVEGTLTLAQQIIQDALLEETKQERLAEAAAAPSKEV